MLKFLKTTVAEDVITTEEVLEVLEAEEILLQEEKETLLQDVKADLEATEVQLLKKVVLVEEANQEVHQLLELVVFQTELQDLQKLQDVTVVLRKDRQDALKVLVIHQEKEDQEEVNTFC